MEVSNKSIKYSFLILCIRSLVALSLILAILLFKPAPIYILDEVDAALDLSHTQNIGQMLHAHFKQSQVCSWNYCDCLFSFVIFRGSQLLGILNCRTILFLSHFSWIWLMAWQLKLLSITSSYKQLLHWLRKAGTDKEDGLCTAN